MGRGGAPPEKGGEGAGGAQSNPPGKQGRDNAPPPPPPAAGARPPPPPTPRPAPFMGRCRRSGGRGRAGGAEWISRQPLEKCPQVARLDRLTARRPDRDATTLPDAVPGFRSGDARKLVCDVTGRGRRVEQDGQGL